MEVQRKKSKKRDAILACICSTNTHPTADWVYAQLKPEIPDLSLGTVYRNIAMFRREGTIASVGVVNGLERFDGCTAPHVHFICTKCGCVHDVLDLEVPQQLKSQVAETLGGQVTDCNLSFSGVCQNCYKLEMIN